MCHRLGFALAAAVIAVACNVGPSADQEETFTGTIQPGSAGTGQEHEFSVAKTGEVSVTVTSLTPPVPFGTPFGIMLGQVSSNQCLALQTNNFATVGVAAINAPIVKGTWCVVIYDPRGVFTVAETYVMRVRHP